MGALQIKAKYYVGFCFSEAAITASGQAFNGFDSITKEAKFDRSYIIDIKTIELNVFGRLHVQEWNHQVHVWVKTCVDDRIKKYKFLGPYTYYLTFMFAAVWHGFYPIYFLSFFYYAIGTVNCEFIYKLFVHYKFLRNPFCHALC
jgi:lysophospholipid acyltransferase